MEIFLPRQSPEQVDWLLHVKVQWHDWTVVVVFVQCFFRQKFQTHTRMLLSSLAPPGCHRVSGVMGWLRSNSFLEVHQVVGSLEGDVRQFVHLLHMCIWRMLRCEVYCRDDFLDGSGLFLDVLWSTVLFCRAIDNRYLYPGVKTHISPKTTCKNKKNPEISVKKKILKSGLILKIPTPVYQRSDGFGYIQHEILTIII